MLRLRDERLGVELAVEPRGGGLASLKLRLGGRWTELIAMKPRGWRGGAPWLFPAVGRSPKGPMPIHGFAPESRWTLRRDGRALIASLADSAATRKLFPHAFRLEARYEPKPGGVRVRLRARAEAPFSLGSHLTLKAGPAAVLRSPARRLEGVDRRGMLTRGGPARLSSARAIGGDPRLRDGALSGFSGRPWAELIDAGRRTRVSFSPRGDARIVLWGKPGFLCLEPWLGRPGSPALPARRTLLWELSVTCAPATRAGGAGAVRPPRSTRRA